MIEIKPYHFGDEKQIDPVENTLRDLPDYDKKWRELVLPELSWTAFDDGKIVGMGGLVPYEDSAYGWFQLDKKSMAGYRACGLAMSASIQALRQVVQLAESYRFPYIWTYVQDGFVLGHKLARYLGFKKQEQVGKCWKYKKELQWEVP